MTLARLKAAVSAELKRAATWVSVALLAALPYADDIMMALAEHLPALQPYLPENIYKVMGALVVAANILRSVYTSHKHQP